MVPVDPENREAAGPIDAEDDASLLDAGEEDGASDTDEGFEPEGFERWRRDSALGSVGTGIARGLQNVFAPPPNQPAIVASVPGDPPDPERLQVILDPDDPSKSVALLPPAHEAGDDDPPA
jgi:hypothetical protein